MSNRSHIATHLVVVVVVVVLVLLVREVVFKQAYMLRRFKSDIGMKFGNIVRACSAVFYDLQLDATFLLFCPMPLHFVCCFIFSLQVW